MNIFIAGPREITNLDENIIEKLNCIINKNYNILIGDAKGIDSKVQQFLAEKYYKNVCVYASNGLARNNYGDWKIENVKVNSNVKNFEFYVAKDLEMVKKADYGFMIWNGKSKGTFNNIINLLEQNKEVLLYYTETKKLYNFKNLEEFKKFTNMYTKLTQSLINLLHKISKKEFKQICLF